MKPSILVAWTLSLTFVTACESPVAPTPDVVPSFAATVPSTSQKFVFKHFGRRPTIGKDQGRPPMIPGAAFSNRAVELSRISTTGSPAALAAYSGISKDVRVGLLAKRAAGLGCEWAFNANGALQTRMVTAWTGVATGTEAGFRTNANFTTSFLPLRCGTRHSAGLLIVQQDSRRAALRLVYREMKPGNTLIEEVKITRNGKGTDIGKCSLGDCFLRTAEMVSRDVAPGVGNVITGALVAEGGKPIESLIARLFDANNKSGLPDAFAGWFALAVVSNFEEDHPGMYSPLPPRDTYKPRSKDNFLERVLRVIDAWYDKNRDKIVESLLNYLVEAINAKSPATEEGVRAPRG